MTHQHSPLGASGAERWINCPGSVSLSAGITDEDDDTYSKPGTAAHTLAAVCLSTHSEPWQRMGDLIRTDDSGLRVQSVDKEMADAVQVYLSAIREKHPERNQGNSWIERHFACPSIHKYFYGTADFVHLTDDTLHVWDFKYGVGIVVEVERNPQLMYYACGALEDLGLWDKVDKVVLHICQPRAVHSSGPVRSWEISTDELADWLEDELIPAMDRALVSRETASGEQCRFCPVRRYACPQHQKDAEEAEKLMKEIENGGVEKLSNDQVARFLDLLDVMKIAGKSAAETAVARLQSGQEIPGRKLVKSKSIRQWKEDAEPELKAEFGQQAYTTPELKSPAQIEKLAKGSAFAARWAFKPDNGYTLAKGADTRAAVNKSVQKLFTQKGA
jgi:hypothetical protein